MWFTQEPKARQKVAELRVQQTQNTFAYWGAWDGYRKDSAQSSSR